MVDSAYAQIGKSLKLPTHAYMGLSDSKCLDSQSGLETAFGTVIAALSGINVVSGGGMMDLENCISLEKLVIDNEICGMAYRILDGISKREKSAAAELFADIDESSDFLAHPHTLEWFRTDHYLPDLIDRTNYEEWRRGGRKMLTDKASECLHNLLKEESTSVQTEEIDRLLNEIMNSSAKKSGIGKLPTIY
jgi:trimethylamine--corrinoid protein Co-methyltransferase